MGCPGCVLKCLSKVILGGAFVRQLAGVLSVVVEDRRPY